MVWYVLHMSKHQIRVYINALCHFFTIKVVVLYLQDQSKVFLWNKICILLDLLLIVTQQKLVLLSLSKSNSRDYLRWPATSLSIPGLHLPQAQSTVCFAKDLWCHMPIHGKEKVLREQTWFLNRNNEKHFI